MKKIFVCAVLIVFVLSACGTPAPTAAPATAIPPTVAPPTEVPPTPTPVPPVDSNMWYRLENKSLGDTLAIDIINVGSDSHALQMAKVGDYSGQYWKFIPVDDGSYQMTNAFLADRNLVLDVRDDGRAIMAEAGDSSTQHWAVTLLGDGSIRLTRQSSGEGFSLAISSDGRNKFIMAETKDDSLQYWILIPLGSIQ
jgi:hypothetical protein